MSTSERYSWIEYLLFPPKRLDIVKLQKHLEGKTVLITGASFGIGEALARQLAGTTAHLILVARTAEKLKQLKDELTAKGAKISIYPTDLTQTESIESLLKVLHDLTDGVDIVVSNAGKSIRRPLMSSLDRYHDFTRTMALNYFGPVHLLLDLIPILEKNKGHVINVSAVNVLLAPAPFWAAYQASKAAFDNWFRCAAPELNAAGIRTTSIYLPLVKTRMIEPTAEYRNVPAMTPQHVSKIICRSIYTGSKRFAPWWLIFAQVSSILFRAPWEASMRRLIRQKVESR